MNEKLDIEIDPVVLPRLRKVWHDQVMVPGLLNSARDGLNLSIGFYERAQVESANFLGKVVIAGDLEMVVIQPRVLEALRTSRRLTIVEDKIILQ